MASTSRKRNLSQETPTAVETAVPSTVVGESPKRPSLAELAKARMVEVSTVQPKSAPLVIAGVICTPEPRTYEVSAIAALGESFMRALAEDEQINVKIVE